MYLYVSRMQETPCLQRFMDVEIESSWSVESGLGVWETLTLLMFLTCYTLVCGSDEWTIVITTLHTLTAKIIYRRFNIGEMFPGVSFFTQVT